MKLSKSCNNKKVKNNPKISKKTTLSGSAVKNPSTKKENNKPHMNHSKNAHSVQLNSQNPNLNI
jgi:hypothetical protein